MKKFLKDIFFIIIGSFILAFGVNVFLVPNEISAGGVSGIATVLYIVFKVPLSATVISVNLLLFVFGWRTLTKKELLKSLIGIIFLSAFLEITLYFPKYTDDLLMSAIFGGLICGFGISLVIMRGASTGGTDMFAMMVSKKMSGLSYAAIIFITDAVIVAVSGVAFSSITIMFYAAICLFFQAKVVDLFAVMGSIAKQIQVVSDKAEIIAEKILESGRGVTGVYIKGFYTGKDKMMLMCVAKSRELGRVIKIIKNADKFAFITIGEVKEVIGEGFKNIEE